MATLQHNITTVLTQDLLKAGENVSSIKYISIANMDASSAAKIDLFLNKGANNYYLLRNIELPIQTTLVLGKEDNISFNNKSNGFSLRIQVDNGSTAAVPVDIIITRDL